MKKFAKFISTVRADLTESMNKYGSALAKIYTNL
jgi:hypothetical protein